MIRKPGTGRKLTVRAKKTLAKHAPKLIEDEKVAILLKGAKSNQMLNNLMMDLYKLKKPNAVMYQRNNSINPFPDSEEKSDSSSLEFLLQKSFASLFVISHTSKKKPNRIYIGRSHDHLTLDVFDLEITNLVTMSNYKGSKVDLGAKPCFVFKGGLFSHDETYKSFKSQIVDFFHGIDITTINVEGINFVIAITVDEQTHQMYWRTYFAKYTNTGADKTLPVIELLNHGPDFDFSIKKDYSSPELRATAYIKPKDINVRKKEKNISYNKLGNTLGNIHLGNQDLDKLTTRKVRALKGKSTPSNQQ